MNSKNAIYLTLALPAWFDSHQGLFDALGSRFPALKHFHSAKTTQGPLAESMLFKLLSPEHHQQPPFAALSALGSNMVEEDCYWLRADPIELLVDAGNICMVGRNHLGVANDEGHAIINTLNSLLQEDNLEIIPGSNQEWFLKISQLPNIKTTPLHEVIARDIKAYLPAGNDQKWWNRLLTELQMLLYSHHVNADRQAKKRPVINSIWFWGEGQMQPSYQLLEYTKIWSDHSLIKGLLRQGGQLPLWQSVSEFRLEAINSAGNYLLTLDHYEMSLERLLDLLGEIFLHYQDREIHGLALYLGNGTIFRWRHSRFCFWKK